MFEVGDTIICIRNMEHPFCTKGDIFHVRTIFQYWVFLEKVPGRPESTAFLRESMKYFRKINIYREEKLRRILDV